MKTISNGDGRVPDDAVRSFETCVQCRGCETACPSAVPFGHLIESTRSALVRSGLVPSAHLKLALRLLEYPAILRFATSALAIATRLKLLPKRLGVPDGLPLLNTPLENTGDDVYLFTGCVMDAWQRDVHAASIRVISAAGFGVTPTGSLGPCCGALHVHTGLQKDARRLARRVIAELSQDDRPIVVNSAGCGAAMKDFGRLLDTSEARAFSERVIDIHEWLECHIDSIPNVVPLDIVVAIQDPCHLRHVQRVHEATRVALSPFVSALVELDDDGICCGAGGAYMVLEPRLAASIRDRKLTMIERAGANVVASANPGCSIHLENAGVQAVHPVQLIDQAIASSNGKEGAVEIVARQPFR